jgi:hypothetical protein
MNEQQKQQQEEQMRRWNALAEKASDYPESLTGVESRLNERIARINRRNKKTVFGSLSAVAAAFIFVLLVNTNAAFASSVSDLPLIGTLAEYVKFDRSLSNAIQNDYVQEVGLIAWDGDKQLSLPFIISDEKNLVLFFQLPKDFKLKEAEGAQVLIEKMTNADTGEEIGESWSNYQACEQGDDQTGYMQISIHTADVSLPESVNIKVTLELNDPPGPEYYEGIEPGEEVGAPDPINAGTFDFHLQLNDLAKPRVYELHENYTVLGQEVTLEQVKVYPTGTEVKIAFPEANPSSINGMDLAIEQEGKVIAEGIKNGTSAVSDQNSTTVFIESNYFVEAKPQQLLIRGMRLLDKDQVTVTVDLNEKTISPKIPGVKVKDVTKGKTGKAELTLTAKVTDQMGFNLFGSDYSDTAGNHYTLNGDFTGIEDSIMTYGINVVVPDDGKLIFQRSMTPMQYLEEPVRIELPQ